ncbi:uncharacterized protein BDR25DRAFT_313422 [Lindgomyces ingoldianus]|uniref:Uncharacterized protein n=1 Tax=Lindgomyces ingoldianus TaxID=673940 RepID=A0ACB6R0B9_9PLEO|nr:uncharacterized protein BDR25DRAFT_313422 [Lindgomyces ingoldianus]KAF2472268.1 hypothetical protein BDR25DRAFT_313422 [Lindgomyces ingoldianus]
MAGKERSDKDIQSIAKGQRIENEILLKAQAGFQWVILVTEIVTSGNLQGIRAEKLREKLASTPEALTKLYAALLSEVAEAEQRQMVKLFSWVLFAERPLSAQELRDALATDENMSYTSVFNLRSDENWSDTLVDFERHARYISKGLVEFQSREVWERYEPNREDSDREAQLIHQSVADYLLDKFINKVKYSQYGFRSHIGAGHFQISKSCLRYLTLREMLEGAPLPPPPSDGAAASARLRGATSGGARGEYQAVWLVVCRFRYVQASLEIALC